MSTTDEKTAEIVQHLRDNPNVVYKRVMEQFDISHRALVRIAETFDLRPERRPARYEEIKEALLNPDNTNMTARELSRKLHCDDNAIYYVIDEIGIGVLRSRRNKANREKKVREAIETRSRAVAVRHRIIELALFDPDNHGSALRALGERIGAHTDTIRVVMDALGFTYEDSRITPPPGFVVPEGYVRPDIYEGRTDKLKTTPRPPKQDIQALIDQGTSIEEAAKHFGCSVYEMKSFAKELMLKFPETVVIRGGAKRFLEQTVFAIDAAGSDLRSIDINVENIDKDVAKEWAEILFAALTDIRRFHNQLREHAK